MPTCGSKGCRREAVGSVRQCPGCRQRKRKHNTRLRGNGLCYCGRPLTSGYCYCQPCRVTQIQRQRALNGYNTGKHLYVARVIPHGIKVGASVDPVRRMPEVRKEMRRQGCPVQSMQLLNTYELQGHLEPFVHYELGDYRAKLPNGNLSTEILSCDLETAMAAVDRVIAWDLLT